MVLPKICAIWHEVIRWFSAAFCLITNNLCMVPVLSCGSVDKKPDGCRDDLFKFKARPLDRKVACVNTFCLFLRLFYECCCFAVYSDSCCLTL